jgi:hypothetical protein
MKPYKIFSVLLVSLALMASTFQAKAQHATLMRLAAGDTLVTSASSDTVSKVLTVTAGYATLTFQVEVNKISGTVDGKVYLYSSLDGSDYQLTDSSAVLTDATSNVRWFDKVAPGRTYYKVQVRPVGADTESFSAQVRVYYSAKPYYMGTGTSPNSFLMPERSEEGVLQVRLDSSYPVSIHPIGQAIPAVLRE